MRERRASPELESSAREKAEKGTDPIEFPIANERKTPLLEEEKNLIKNPVEIIPTVPNEDVKNVFFFENICCKEKRPKHKNCKLCDVSNTKKVSLEV